MEVDVTGDLYCSGAEFLDFVTLVLGSETVRLV